jgi:hypothetical protein
MNGNIMYSINHGNKCNLRLSIVSTINGKENVVDISDKVKINDISTDGEVSITSEPISMKSVKHILSMHIDRSPEARLVIDIICQALLDAGDDNQKIRADALDFIFGSRLESLCEMIGIEPDFAREVAIKSGCTVVRKKH